MAQGFITLEEAAGMLGMPPEELNRMAQRREVRAFADRGTWRFRSQDIEELAQTRGTMGNAPQAAADEPAIFGFAPEDDNLDLGQDWAPGPSGSGTSSGSAVPLGADDDLGILGPDDDFNLPLDDDDVLLGNEPKPAASPSGTRKRSGLGSSKSMARRRTGMGSPARQDSGVPMMPGDEDDVLFDLPAGRIDDSLISVGDQLDPDPFDSEGEGRKSKLNPDDDVLPTEELINLDEELGQAAPLKPSTRVKPRTGTLPAGSPNLPTVSPFELSMSEFELPDAERKTKAKRLEGGSDFELSLEPGDDDNLQLNLKSDDEDAVELGALPRKTKTGSKPGQSGIHRQPPTDDSLTSRGADVDFDLTLDEDDVDSSRPKTNLVTAKGSATDDEFELTLDDDDLIDAGERAGGDEKDIFETDFDLPALDEESASEAVALEESDSDLESSDFDLALDEPDLEESDSEVVAFGEEEDDDESGPRTSKFKRGEVADLEEIGFEESAGIDEILTDETISALDEEEEEEEEYDEEAVAAAAPADWGVFPALVMIPCAVVMIMVGLMSYELLHGMWGYQQPTPPASPVIHGISKIFAEEQMVKKD
ncbi:MAG: helix-turn-helix domain-containing protein [Gemmataceae bacterium]